MILDVGGVGYQVHCSSRTLQALPSPGEAAVLSIETYVREDQIKLFGFRTDTEREWFRLLQTVQGVGAKVALAVLSTLPPAELANAIALRDKAAVSRTPGVGPKVAERIVTELKDKAPAFANVDTMLWSYQLATVTPSGHLKVASVAHQAGDLDRVAVRLLVTWSRPAFLPSSTTPHPLRHGSGLASATSRMRTTECWSDLRTPPAPARVGHAGVEVMM